MKRHQKKCPKCGLSCKDVLKHVLHHHSDKGFQISPLPDVAKPRAQPAERQAPDWRNPQAPGARAFGTINIWTCETCGHKTICRDIHEGTTPFIIGCTKPGCQGDARSGFYRAGPVIADQITHVWRFPTEQEFVALHPLERDHVQRGGLIMFEAKSVVESAPCT